MQADLAEYQERINAVRWYHEFDFPNGLKARSAYGEGDVAFHRRLWKFIQEHLDKIEFRNRSVLDIGCWDGYWSFYAERLGAAPVLATDDQTQNWAKSSGLLLAQELLGSAVDTRLDVSIYNLDCLARQFDIILCLGVYYHLVDPFYAFSQIRHRCHSNTIVVFEGDVTTGMPPSTVRIDLSNPALPIFLPTPASLNHLLGAAYLEPVSQVFMTLPGEMARCLTVCRPFAGVANQLHFYMPPFGLAAYDQRFMVET